MSEFKMKDYFPQAFLSEINPSFEVMDADFVCYGDEYNTKADQDSAIQHAVLNHDRLVEENQRLTAIATKHATRADELHEALESLINAAKNNTGNEPSLSCYHKAIDDAVDTLDKSRIEAEKGDGVCN